MVQLYGGGPTSWASNERGGTICSSSTPAGDLEAPLIDSHAGRTIRACDDIRHGVRLHSGMFSSSAAHYDALYTTFKDFAAEARALHELVQRTSPGAATMLDVACGTGLHDAVLRDHYQLTGVDVIRGDAQGRTRT